jgi:hypothetical protein
MALMQHRPKLGKLGETLVIGCDPAAGSTLLRGDRLRACGWQAASIENDTSGRPHDSN